MSLQIFLLPSACSLNKKTLAKTELQNICSRILQTLNQGKIQLPSLKMKHTILPIVVVNRLHIYTSTGVFFLPRLPCLGETELQVFQATSQLSSAHNKELLQVTGRLFLRCRGCTVNKVSSTTPVKYQPAGSDHTSILINKTDHYRQIAITELLLFFFQKGEKSTLSGKELWGGTGQEKRDDMNRSH